MSVTTTYWRALVLLLVVCPILAQRGASSRTRRAVRAVAGPQAPDWKVEVAIESVGGFGGCATGELLPDHPGQEIVAVAKDGAVHLAWWDAKAERWRSEVVHRAQGELIQVTVGDVDPRHAGNEILGVGVTKGPERSGSPGAAVVIRRTEAGWRGEVVFEAKALLHGACVQDGHGFVTGYDHAVHRLVRTEKGWRAEKLADLPAAGKAALATQHGIVIACTDGSLARIEPSADRWTVRILDKRASGRSRLGTDGRRIIVSDNDGTLSILTPLTSSADGRAAGYQREEIHRESALQRGAVLADLDPTTPGLEAATAGYEFKISLLRHVDGRWWSRLLYRDSDRLHHLTAGEVDGTPGLELVACGYSGRLLVLRRIGR